MLYLEMHVRPSIQEERDSDFELTALPSVAEEVQAVPGRVLSEEFGRVPVGVAHGQPGLRSGRRMDLFGRQRECMVLAGLVEGARAGRSGVLVVRGEAGVGKTALLDCATSCASDLRLAPAVGVESEMTLAYAALHQLCAPMLDQLDRLPDPQRDALRTVFGLSESPAPDRLFVGLAVLGLLSKVAEQRPLVCVIDDAQWLDRPSAQVLAFVARRLLAESVVMVFAAREPSDALRGLPELVVEGLQEAEAHELFRSAIQGRLDDEVAGRIVAEARGNPMALLELARELSAAQVAGGFGLPGAWSLRGPSEDGFLERLQALPEDTRRLLLVAAAEPAGDPVLMMRTAAKLGIPGPALERVEYAGWLEVGARVRFRHPLMRPAVYRAVSPDERRRVHLAIAQVIDPNMDPDRQAWHRAQATAGYDEDIAAELVRTASRAQARGGVAAAAAFLERAAALTIEPSRRTPRALAAAQAKFEAGSVDGAVALLTAAASDATDDLQRARVDALRAQIELASRRGSNAPLLLLKAARDLEAADPNLARTTYLEALNAAMLADPLAPGGASVVEVSQSALAGPLPPKPPRPHDLLLDGLAIRFTEGYAAGAQVLKQALSAFRSDTTLPLEEARWLLLACSIASDLCDDEAWAELSARHMQLVEDAGALTARGLALSARSVMHVLSGELTAAASLLDEARVITEAKEIPTAGYGAVWLAALRGREAHALEVVESAHDEAVAPGERHALVTSDYARAALYNALGRYDAALDAVRETEARPDGFGPPAWARAELIEAAARSRQPQLGRRTLELLAETARASGTDWAFGIEARSRALLSDGLVADTHYRSAIERLERTLVRLELARAHLLYGEWLRRERRRVEAREQLRTAYEMFVKMGAEAFADRAARELMATGERVRKRTVETREDLTAQEAQVARLARDGFSNPEIGARLFISPRTVEYHLHKVFTKLGISSRNALSVVLPPERGAEDASRLPCAEPVLTSAA